MLVIKVEVWPGGRRELSREIGRAAAANVSTMSDRSDYVGVLCDDSGHVSSIYLADHRRAAGFWPLLARIALSRVDAGECTVLEPRWQELADQIQGRMYPP